MHKILIIEDTGYIREELATMLQFEGFAVTTAEHGIAGLAAARQTHPDLILCDIMMPELDGYGVLSAVRADPALSGTPFIFLTAKATRENLRQGMRDGADDYITKPFTADEILAAVRTRLKRASDLHEEAEKRAESRYTNLSNMLPHEINTPLNGILGFADILVEESETLERAEVHEFAKHILLSGRRLQRLVHNMLLYHQLEVLDTDSDRTAQILSFEPADLESTIGDAVVAAVARTERGADLQVQCFPAQIAMSANNLCKVLDELIDNAFKFSPPSSPVQIITTPMEGKIRISVIDEGRGMTEEQVSAAGAFQQFDRKRREQQGVGLGLAIARRLVELHGGTLTLHSRQQQGVVVDLILKTAPGPSGKTSNSG